MYKINFEALELFIDQLPGLLIINMEGLVLYVSDQCSQYFQKEKDEILGEYILDVFPESQMITGLSREEPGFVFYNSNLGIGISFHVPLFKEGKKVGLMEYDVAQHSEFLYEFAKDYSDFLDKELKNLSANFLELGNGRYTINNLSGSSEAMTRLREQIILTARTSSTIMITGETGTGKELAAHAIHNLSTRRKEPFIKVNAASLPEALAESELFGYEKGAFTGANSMGKKGKFELGDKGTLFIDEIDQMPLSVQPKLLRVLQEKELDRIGGDKPISIDTRIIVASNRNLGELVKKGLFREDLYYRLNVIGLEIPPLRERLEDFDQIVQTIINELNAKLGTSVLGIEKEASKILKQKAWNGNIRELHNDLEQAINFASGNILCINDFSRCNEEIDLKGKSLFACSGDHYSLIDKVRDQAEHELLVEALNKYDDNKSQAAKYLGIARPTLYKKMKRMGIKA